MATEYIVVTGTPGAINTFQTAVIAKIDAGYTLVGGPTANAANIYQAVMKDVHAPLGVFPITAVVTGLSGSFKIATDQRINFEPGFRFTVSGSTGNDGIYTVKSTGATLSVTDTVIPVVENVPNATVDGNVIGTT